MVCYNIYSTAHMSSGSSAIKLVWLYGPTGSGKSVYARSHYPAAYIKYANSDWTGYKNQTAVVLEDVSISTTRTFQQNLVRWLSSDDIAITQRGRKRFIRPKIIVVTSYYHPLDFKHLKPFIKTVLSNVRIIHCDYKPLFPKDDTVDRCYQSPLNLDLPIPDSDDESQINMI